VPVAEVPLDAPPAARRTRAAPVQLAGGLDRGVGLLSRRPDAFAALERQHEWDLGRGQRVGKVRGGPVEFVWRRSDR
jgi:hypothetical protein